MTDAPDRPPVIALIGLGPLGRAIGLGLQSVKTNFEVVGHDPDGDRSSAAKSSGAVDRVHWDLATVAESADIVILTASLEATLNDLALVGPIVKEGAVVTDVCPVKAPVMEVAGRSMRQGASFVGGHLIARAAGDLSAGDLRGATWCLVPSRDAEDAAVRLLTRLVRALGADPYYISADEHDALGVGVFPLGYLASSSLLKLFAASPSLRDLRRLAPPEITRLGELWDAELSYEGLMRAEPAAVTGWIDALVRELSTARAAINGSDESWAEYLQSLRAAREAWALARSKEEAERDAVYDELDNSNQLRDMMIGRRRRG